VRLRYCRLSWLVIEVENLLECWNFGARLNDSLAPIRVRALQFPRFEVHFSTSETLNGLEK